MRLLVSLFCVSLHAQTFSNPNNQPGWDSVLSSLGLISADPATAKVLVHAATTTPGKLTILEGHSPLAASLGITPTGQTVEIRQIRDTASPELPIVWQTPLSIDQASLDTSWTIRARDRWSNSPVLATRPGALWTATPIGQSGYERYPFLPQALLAAGLDAPVKAGGLWAFFDAGFRQRADLRYLVSSWKTAGLGGIHVTSWQFDDASPERAAWLKTLIDLCHENLILVYAWVELPHVSERFWQQHPQCRERTASGMEASLDWRRLMTLVDPQCSQLAEDNILALLRRFDWDGVNLGELYFESLEGHLNPARFTPFHDSVRAEYKQLHGRDPLEDLKGEGLATLLEYRANLAARLQSDWLARLEVIRRERPGFDIVVTHIDDRFDTRMRDALGADAARILRSTEGQGTGFLIEDPATVWHLGPARYREIRKRYEPLTTEHSRLSIDINIVDRYQDVYPTRRQTGAELAQLVHEAASSFDQVALYFEYSLRPVDLPLLGLAASRLTAWQQTEEATTVTLAAPSLIHWQGPALVNGTPWPLTDGKHLHLPAGTWRIEKAQSYPHQRIIDCNIRLAQLTLNENEYTITYTSRTNGTVIIESPTGRLRHTLKRGSGTFTLSAKPPAASVESNSAQLRLQR